MSGAHSNLHASGVRPAGPAYGPKAHDGTIRTPPM